VSNKERTKTISAAAFATMAVGFMIFLIVMAWPAFAKISDLPEFYAAGRMVLSGNGAQVYDIAQQRAAQHALFPGMEDRVIGFFVNPFALPMIVPIGWVPVDAVRYVWKALLSIALGLSIWLIKRIFELDFRGTLWLIAVMLCSGAAYEAMRIDQVSSFMLCGFCFALWALKEERPVLAALGMSVVLLKPQELLPMLLFMLGARKYKPLICLCVLSAILALIGYCELGTAGMIGYKDLISSTATSAQYLQTNLSPTLRGQLFLLFPNMKAVGTAISSGVFVVSLGFIYYCGRYFSGSHKWLQAALLCSMPLGFAASPYFFDYDLLMLVPSLVVLMKEPLQEKIPQWALLLGMLGSLLFTVPFAVQIHYEYLLKGGTVNPFFWMLLLFSIGVVVFAFKNKQFFDEYV